MTSTTLTDIRTVAVPASDQRSAVTFYLERLGFEKRMDAEIEEGFRWVEVAPPGARVSIAITAAVEGASGIDTGIRLTTPDAAAEHAAMRERGIDVDDLLEMPGIPPMFTFRDGDGNTLYVVEG
ncbi:MAG TPA: VOC family protein [Microbacterium sp.]|nr:VOC family protein [Microbacterium sp.]